ncbi:calpain [Colletotrichum costaricense]|uniref:Calpain n=2 Tax=Colletotrichum acutatum species complex TaxID=2707335 RepID=A0AAJ0E5M4_9PEZI|nr:calpain [Colletotrichum costaricense]XP_060383297.1 calpain [Colletotrichum tamarilloi]KAK1501352.1 calpain [Colletotrichum tamarilloi]KAK1537382.1 calpain [Colletotrichum costaricense]
MSDIQNGELMKRDQTSQSPTVADSTTTTGNGHLTVSRRLELDVFLPCRFHPSMIQLPSLLLHPTLPSSSLPSLPGSSQLDAEPFDSWPLMPLCSRSLDLTSTTFAHLVPTCDKLRRPRFPDPFNQHHVTSFGIPIHKVGRSPRSHHLCPDYQTSATTQLRGEASNMPLAAVNLPASLDDVRVKKLPPSSYYIADFISEEEERLILQKIAEAPKPRWKQLTHRRLQTWPSDLVNNKLIDAPLPQWLQEPVISRILSLPLAADSDSSNLFASSPHKRPNHVLINEYPSGDGAAYHPVVCTVSLGASLCLNLYQTKEDGAMDPEPVGRILQEPRSLLITTDDLYTDYLHGIADVEEDVELSAETIVNWDLLRSQDDFSAGRSARATRTSLTYRDVMQVSKLGAKFGLFGKK